MRDKRDKSAKSTLNNNETSIEKARKFYEWVKIARPRTIYPSTIIMDDGGKKTLVFVGVVAFIASDVPMTTYYAGT